jgi:hypothetical protein
MLTGLLPAKLQPYAKTVAAVLGTVATVVASSFANTRAGAIATGVVGVLTAVGVYGLKNAPMPPTPTASSAPTGSSTSSSSTP